MRVKVAVCCAALLGLLVSPAMATIGVTPEPAYQEIDMGLGEVATIEIYADIPEADAIIGFGFDADPMYGLLDWPGAFVAGPLFTGLGVSPDGDGIAAYTLDPVFGDDILLGTLTFTPVAGGLEKIALGNTAGDLTEGFPLVTVGGFADVVYTCADVNIIPEPATLTLLALGGLALLRRR